MMMHLVPSALKTTREKKMEKTLTSIFEDEYTDVSFAMSEGGIIRAHRSLLARNQVFKAMFAENRERREFEVSGSLVPFRAFLQHFYEILDLAQSPASPLDVYQLAEMYKEATLKKTIVHFLEKETSSKRLLEMYTLGATMSDSPFNRKLKRKAEEGIAGQLDKVVKTEEFQQFFSKHVNLVPELMTSLSELKTKTN